MYAFDPVPAGLTDAEAARVVGVQANVWTEHMDSARVVDYMAFPRLCAVAEVALERPGPRRRPTSPAGCASTRDGCGPAGVEYRRDDGPLPWQTRPDARGWPT